MPNYPKVHICKGAVKEGMFFLLKQTDLTSSQHLKLSQANVVMGQDSICNNDVVIAMSAEQNDTPTPT